MTAQARLLRLFGHKRRKGDDGVFSAHRVYVRLSGAVTSRAAGVIGPFPSRSHALEMRVSIKRSGDIRMTWGARLAARARTWLSGRRPRARGKSGD